MVCVVRIKNSVFGKTETLSRIFIGRKVKIAVVKPANSLIVLRRTGGIKNTGVFPGYDKPVL